MPQRMTARQYMSQLFEFSDLTFIQIQLQAVDKLLRDIDDQEREWRNDSRKHLGDIAREFRQQAQLRSPYLFGILQGSHFDEVIEIEGEPAGLVSLKRVEHPYIGGFTDEYGPRIHNYDNPPRPWFSWTVEQEAQGIISKYSSEIASSYLTAFEGGGGFF